MCKKFLLLISVVLLLSMVGNTSAALKYYWDLDEGTGTKVHDLVGDHEGTFFGDPAWVDSNALTPPTNCGKALEFDGVGDAVRVGVINPTGSFSVSFWAYIMDWRTGWGDCPIANRGNGDGWSLRHFGPWWGSQTAYPDPNYDLTDAFCFTTRGIGHASDNVEDSPSNTVPEVNEWIHIACVYNSVTHKKYIYFDGVQDAVWDTNATEASYNPSWQSVYLGSRSNATDTGPDSYYDYTGRLDDVRFYDHALSPAEVIPGYKEARKPNPYNNETIKITNPTLQWEKGCGAASVDKYHVWFNEDWNDVHNSTQDANKGTTTNKFYGPIAGLDRNKYYYWRIDTIIGATTYPGYLWKFFVQPEGAFNPDPCDFHGFASVEPILSWNAGSAATTGHNVYFGNTFAEVNNAPTGSILPPYKTTLPVADTNWAPSESGISQLSLSTTYYWRIDETGPPIKKGVVWRFTTVPAVGLGHILFELWTGIQNPEVNNLTNDLRYPDNPVSSSQPTLFESPYTGDNYGVRMHGWLYIYADDENDYTFWIASDDNSQLWLSTDDSSDNAVKIAYVEGPDCPDGFTASREWDKYRSAQRSDPIHLLGNRTYYIMALHKESTGNDNMAVAWSTSTDPNDAEIIDGRYLIPYVQKASFRPVPMNHATNVEGNPILNWKPGKYVSNKCKYFDVYFGTDEDAVTDANRSIDPCGVLVKQDHDSNSIDIADEVGLLKFDTTYYWRIDDVNNNPSAPQPHIWSSRVWSFTTGRHFVVEDFERYANTTALKTVWQKKPAAGTVVDINAVRDIGPVGQIHKGKQAMALKYNNTLSRSEAYADSNGANSLEFGFNWRIQNVKALSLWFHGIPDLRGSKSGATDPYTLNGDGSGILGVKKDVFYYFYRGISGQTTGLATARVDSIENTDPSAMAGIMMRDTLNENSPYAATVVTPDGRVIFMYRSSTGSNGANSGSVSDITLPHWVRIGSTFSAPLFHTIASHANDVSGHPDKWTQIGPDIPTGLGNSPLYLGLCLTSNSYGDICTAKFGQVDLNSPPGTRILDPCATADIGNYVYNDPEAMYVVLQDGDSNEIVYYYHGNKDTTVTQTGEWKEWRIDLNDFNDQHNMTLTNIRRMYIGIGEKPNQSSGSGTMYFDDIALYGAEFYEPECPPLPGDLVRDGEVNYKDLKILTDNWLISDYVVTPAAPSPGPVSWYQLDNNANDTGSPGGYPGTASGGPTYTNADKQEGTYAINLDGIDDYVQTTANAAAYGIAGNHARTITAWAKARTFDDQYRGLYEIGGEEENGQEFSMVTKGEEPNVWRANHWGGPEEWDIDFEYPSLNTWVHFAHVYDGNTVRVYVDGIARADTVRVVDLNTTNTMTFSIGRWSFGGYFDGIVDDVRIYNYALTQNKVAYIANTGTFTQPLYLLLTPQNPDIDLNSDGSIDFKDFAVMANHWGETQVWPTWDP